MRKTPLPQWMDKKHPDRGGWAGLVAICQSELPYAEKLQAIQDKYNCAQATASDWYSDFKKIAGTANEVRSTR